LPPVSEMIEDVDVSSVIEQVGSLRPGVPVWRGIWFPPQPYDTGA
jgi:hypothetical protein